MKPEFSIKLEIAPTDDAAFVEFAKQFIVGAVVTHKPANVRIFKIDHWFDYKWLAFSGKALGALGVWNKRLTIPPFVANRIVGQWHYELDESAKMYQLTGAGSNIHHRGWAANNLHRFVDAIVPNSALFWFSGDTTATGRGSLMGYIPTEEGYWPWFLSFVRQKEWTITRRNSIHEYEVRLFQSAGEAVTAGIAAAK